MMIKASDLFDLKKFRYFPEWKAYCQEVGLSTSEDDLTPLQLAQHLRPFLSFFLKTYKIQDAPLVFGKVAPGAYIEGPVYIAEGATVEETAKVIGPCFIGSGAEVRHGAFLRGNVIVSAKAVVGHVSEVKDSWLFDEAKAAHFAYVGNSLLGNGVNLGAGTKLANLKFDHSPIKYHDPILGVRVNSGEKKFGAWMGDGSQTGCNSVLDPGSILFPQQSVLPCAYHRGTKLR